MYKTDGRWHPAVGHRELSLVLYYDSDGWVGGSSWEGGLRERGYVFIYSWFMPLYNTETNTSLKSSNTSIKKETKRKKNISSAPKESIVSKPNEENNHKTSLWEPKT